MVYNVSLKGQSPFSPSPRNIYVNFKRSESLFTLTKIWIYRVGDDNPRMCTAVRLSKFGLATIVRTRSALPRRALLLDPYSAYALSPSDEIIASKYGIALIDASWEHVRNIFPKIKNKERRALPFLVAGNPVKQDQPMTLSTAEAVAAALYIIGHMPEAISILSAFRWGYHFMEINKRLLDEYSACSSSSDVVSVQLRELERRQRDTRNPPSVLNGI